MVKCCVETAILREVINDMRNKHDYVHVIFPLTQDESGYPSVGSERLWAKRLEDHTYEIDNIPFFVQGISSGDIITAEEKDGALFFEEVKKHSGNSTLRVSIFGDDDIKQKLVRELRNMLSNLGCETEVSHTPNLLSVEVPITTSLKVVIDYLKKGAEEGKWDYEEATLRQ